MFAIIDKAILGNIWWYKAVFNFGNQCSADQWHTRCIVIEKPMFRQRQIIMQCSGCRRRVFNFQNQCWATQTNLRGCQWQQQNSAFSVACCIALHNNTLHIILPCHLVEKDAVSNESRNRCLGCISLALTMHRPAEFSSHCDGTMRGGNSQGWGASPMLALRPA